MVSGLITMDNHTKSVSKSFFHHIRSLRHIRSSLDDDMAVLCRIGHSVVAPGLRKFYFAWLPAEAFSASSTGPERPSPAVVQPQSRALPLSSSCHLHLKQLHWLPIDCLLSPLKNCTQVARNTSPIYCTSINPLGLCALPTLNY